MPKIIKSELPEGGKIQAVKVGSETNIHNLPTDVLNIIFILLPARTLVRITRVCKSWLRLIRCDPQFALRHYFARSSSVSPSMMAFSWRKDGYYWDADILNSFTLTKNKTFRFASKFELTPIVCELVSNFCHGMTCLLIMKNIRKNFVVFNPTTREVVNVPLPINFVVYIEKLLGFGYDSKRNDYKIIVIMNVPRTNTMQEIKSPRVGVYSVRSGQWHNLHDIGPLGQVSTLEFEPALNAEGRILNFIAEICVKGRKEWHLLSFDMVDEVFRVNPLPEKDYDLRVLLESSSQWEVNLCCNFYNNGFEVLDIWVLNGRLNDACNYHDSKWSKQLSVRLPCEYNLLSVGDFWVSDTELILFLQKKIGKKIEPEEMYVYNIATQQLKRTGRKGNPYILIYGESLVSIKGLMSSYDEALYLKQDHVTKKNVENEEDTNCTLGRERDQDFMCFIREVLGKRHVRWSTSIMSN